MSIAKSSKGQGRTAPKRAPKGLGYVPVGTGNLGFGVVRRTLGGQVNDTRESVWKKLHPVGRPASWSEPWHPTAGRSDVLLPTIARDDLTDPFVLTRAYEEASWPTMKDLIVAITFKLSDDRVHPQFERVRAFVRNAFCNQRNLAVVLALHTPRAAGVDRAAHIHAMVLPRLLADNFGTFAESDLTSDRGAPMIAAEWAAWRD